MFNQYEFLVSKLGITAEDIARYITGSKGELPEPFILPIDTILNAIDKLRVYTGYSTYQSTLKSAKLIVNNIEFLVGNELSLLLNESEKVAVFVCTIGQDFEKELKYYDKLEDTYFIDVIGSVIVEKLMDKLVEIVRKNEGGSNYKTTNTISPGNCGWRITDQVELFKLMPENIFGITLNSSGMMNPIKSISGIIGIGKNVSTKHTECAFCSSKNCIYRKVEYNN